jgi:hypothetical protein
MGALDCSPEFVPNPNASMAVDEAYDIHELQVRLIACLRCLIFIDAATESTEVSKGNPAKKNA